MQGSTNLRKLIADSIAWLFILLWIYAAANKLLDVQTFKVKLGQSPLLTPIAGFVAWFIPMAEVLIAVLLVRERTQLTGLYASFGLMVLFTGYIITITQFSDFIPCSCGGILEHMTWNQHLIFNIGFVALAVIGILANPSNHISLQRIRTSRKPV
jgi:uncharacterized membrane protein YphA (DoxX/SURF4 family)